MQCFVQNASSTTADHVEVLVSPIADGDVVVGSTYAHIAPTMLKPGGRGPWLARFKSPPDFVRVRARVEARPVADVSGAVATQDFRLEDVVVQPPADLASSPTTTVHACTRGGRARCWVQ